MPKESLAFTSEAQKLYNSLNQKERDFIKKSKKRYPNVRKTAWREYDKLAERAFNAIKNEKQSYAACDALDKFSFDNWNPDSAKDFLTAYAKCSLEQSGIDPEKVAVVHCVSNNCINSNKKNCETAIHFKNNACLIDFYEDNGYKKKGISYQPQLHIGPMDYVSQDDLAFQLVMINKAVSLLATSAAIKQAVFKQLVLAYYGVEPLFDQLLIKEWGENSLYYGDIEKKLHAMFDDNALLISLIKHPELVDYVCNNLENRAEQTSEIKKMLRFLYKIKKLKAL